MPSTRSRGKSLVPIDHELEQTLRNLRRMANVQEQETVDKAIARMLAEEQAQERVRELARVA